MPSGNANEVRTGNNNVKREELMGKDCMIRKKTERQSMKGILKYREIIQKEHCVCGDEYTPYLLYVNLKQCSICRSFSLNL